MTEENRRKDKAPNVVSTLFMVMWPLVSYIPLFFQLEFQSMDNHLMPALHSFKLVNGAALELAFNAKICI